MKKQPKYKSWLEFLKDGAYKEESPSSEVDETLNKRKNQSYIYHLAISAWGICWLHIEMKGSATLSKLDNFLREIWLECCGHVGPFEE